MKSTLTENIILFIWVSLMASSFVVSEQLLPYANPIASTGLRFILATLMMLVFVNKASLQQINVKILWQYSIISLLLVLFFLGLFEALKTTTAMKTSVIYTLVPLCSVVLAFFTLKVVTSLKLIFAFIIGSTGAILVLFSSTEQVLTFGQWQIGDSIFLGACCCLSLHVILIKKWTNNVPARLGAFLIMLLGSLLLLPFLLLFGDLNNVAWQHQQFWQVLLYLTVFTTVATFILQQYLLKRVGPNRLLAFTYLIPILVMIPQGVENIYNLNSTFIGVFFTILALYLISKKSTNA
jgi:drug/metabolite transporter (DMT)-like permease